MPRDHVIRARQALGMVQRNVTLLGRKTTLRLEAATWEALERVVEIEGTSLAQLLDAIHLRRGPTVSLASAIRVFVVAYFRNMPGERELQPAPDRSSLSKKSRSSRRL